MTLSETGEPFGVWAERSGGNKTCVRLPEGRVGVGVRDGKRARTSANMASSGIVQPCTGRVHQDGAKTEMLAGHNVGGTARGKGLL